LPKRNEFLDWSDEELESGIDMIIQRLSKEINGTILVANPKRIQECKSACEKLTKLLRNGSASARFKIERGEFTQRTVFLICTTQAVEVTNIPAFLDAIKYANNFEIVPLSNGKIEFSIGFYDCFVPVGKI